MLKCETNTPAMERRIRSAAAAYFRRKRELQTDFEHGQWWVTHRPTGAQWGVHDAGDGFDFEQVTRGED